MRHLIRRLAYGPISAQPSGDCWPPLLQKAAEARVALEELYRLYCYPIYAFIRRRGYGRQDAQDLTQSFFVHLLDKGTLGRADSERGRFRNFLLGSLEHFLAHAAERA